MTRDCFERVSGFLALGSAVCGAAFAAATGAGPDIAGRFLADLDIEILRSVAAPPAPPKPRHGDRAGGAGSRSALGARKLTTVPLQSERIASHFSTMSLRGSATFDRRIKADGTTAAVLVRVRRVGAYFCDGAMRPRLQH